MIVTPAEQQAVLAISARLAADPCMAEHTFRVYDPDADETYFRYPQRYRFARCTRPGCGFVTNNPELVRIARAEAMEDFSS